MKTPTRFIGALSILVLIGGCSKTDEAKTPPPPVVYCSVDEVFAKEVLREFEKRTSITPVVVFDFEAGKTTGLVNRIIAEDRAGSHRADVFWSSEIFNTILLARHGLLESYVPPSASDVPDAYKNSQGYWTALALRARVLAFDPEKTPADEVPKTWAELAAPEMAKRTALANPLFGTTRGHIAAMFALWGEEKARSFLSNLRENDALIVDGNSAAVRAVLSGRVAFAATDTDDVIVARRAGEKLEMAYLDMGDGGTLLIPCSVAVVRGGLTKSSKTLVDFLVSADVERMLAKSSSRNIPVRESLRKELGVKLPPSCEVSFEDVADAMDKAESAVREILIR